MKKSSLTTAVLAGLAGLVGFAGSSQAVEINPDGTGQVLIYPYYTVQAGQQTYISVVNSTDIAKAVKVRFLESYNSREVRDFNLFLSPYDVWTGTIFSLSDVGKSGDGAAFGTSDNSCTVPSLATGAGTFTVGNNLHAIDFSNATFSGAANDGGPSGTERTREGYVELIQMSDIAAGSATETAVTHVQPAGMPPGCASGLLRNTGNPHFVEPTGGLFGAGQVIDVANGTLYPYNADAIDGFSVISLFTDSGSLDPNLSAANTAQPSGDATAYVFQGTGVVSATYPAATSIDAVSAVFDASSLMNEWISNAAGGTGTDWVVTFPTKRFYVDKAPPAIQPFPKVFADGTACTQVDVGQDHMFNREELTTTVTTDDDFSPRPPGIPPKSLCYEVNVISFSDKNDAVSILGAANPLNLNTADFATSGWLKLGLNPSAEPHAMRPSADASPVTFFGLPATGFSAQRYINANAAPGTLANYAGAFRHRVEREISVTGTVP